MSTLEAPRIGSHVLAWNEGGLRRTVRVVGNCPQGCAEVPRFAHIHGEWHPDVDLNRYRGDLWGVFRITPFAGRFTEWLSVESEDVR